MLDRTCSWQFRLKKKIDGQKERQTDGQKERKKTHKNGNRLNQNRQKGYQTERKTNKDKDRQRERETVEITLMQSRKTDNKE